ncbi:MAG: NADH-quinone oxidoreductase subunit J [Longilinea sp.]|nr:NADH-quinone oxidoreductase subunit J [Longilinea sp.]
MALGSVILFAVLALVVVGSALGMLLSRNAVYAALFLVLNFATVALLYLILGAPFIALTQITVYAGAIMILFLFVIMLLGAEKLPDTARSGRQRWVAALVALVFLAEVGLYVAYRGSNLAGMPALTADFGSPVAVGLALFEKYQLPFEITSVILLSALVGAILLTRQEKQRS